MKMENRLSQTATMGPTSTTTVPASVATQTPAVKQPAVQPVQQIQPGSPLAAQDGGRLSAQASNRTSIPLGVQSVVAAGGSGTIRYLPVPIVTVPERDPPLPPMPQVPTAPNPVMQNAFAPPPQAPGPGGVAQAGYNQMAPYPPMGPGGMMPPMSTPGYPPSYGPGYPPAYGPGYAPAYPGYPPAYGMGGYPPPYGPGPMPAFAGYTPLGQPRGIVYPNVPQGYGGPQPPNPVAHLQMGASMDPPGMPPYFGHPGPVQPVGATPADNVQQMVRVLRSSVFPSQREWCISYLANLDWHLHPEIIATLLSVAHDDPAPTVRTACVLAIGRMGIHPDLARGTLASLRNDSDAAVRQAAEQTLARYPPPVAVAPAVQQVGGRRE
jgi:hypothetical protein